MKRKNLVFGGAAVLTAAAAIGAGVMVSSGAMAAAGTDDPAGVVMSMINVGGDGSAITCKFSAADLPLPAPPGHVATGSGVGGVTVTATATAVAGSGAVVAGEDGVPSGPSFSVGGGTAGPVLVGSGPGVPADGSVPPGALQITGSVSADGTATAVKVNPDGSTSPLEVRDGTPEECANALATMKNATESRG